MAKNRNSKIGKFKNSKFWITIWQNQKFKNWNSSMAKPKIQKLE